MKRTLLLATALLLAAFPGRAQEAGSARVVPIQVTGDPAARFSLVILGDGYTAEEMPTFRRHVDKHLNILWSLEPFRSYRNYINVYAVEIVSGESGITCDPAHREVRTTPLGMRFGGGCDNPNARGINVEQESARHYARMATPDYDQILSIANTDTYGGIGGSTATTSGGNALGPYITPHELGHSLGRLQDEYTYSARGVRGGIYDGEEPNSIHHTLLTEEEMRAGQRKWWRWLGEPSESGGIIRRFEGGQSRVAGVFRPSRHSMMISLGYYFDQVSRERMAERISGQVELIADGTPADATVAPGSTLWIETAHPVFHELDVNWQVDGRRVTPERDTRILDLRTLALDGGSHSVTVTVIDLTPFVRDPVVRDTSFTATRSWTVDPAAPAAAEPASSPFTGRDTVRAVAGEEVVYVATTASLAREPVVRWYVDGREIASHAGRHSIALADQNLARGSHRLSATLSDPARSEPRAVLNWTIDNTLPTVEHTLNAPETSVPRPDGSRHYFARDSFTMHLEPSDDQDGYVVAEFRVNGDGWHHYYGWPDAPPGTPFLFTPRGTTIKELVYGSLSAEGLSPQPWEERAPGWGTHTIEYRARDAAGNIGDAEQFHVTFMPAPQCTTVITSPQDGLDVDAGVMCLDGATVTGSIKVTNGASLFARNTTVRGSVSASAAANVEIVGSTVDGPLHVSGSTGSLVLFNNAFNQNVALTDHRGVAPPVLAGNRIANFLRCDGMGTAPTDLGLPNAVAGSTTGPVCPAASPGAGRTP